jgi:hypothetical protein
MTALFVLELKPMAVACSGKVDVAAEVSQNRRPLIIENGNGISGVKSGVDRRRIAIRE